MKRGFTLIELLIVIAIIGVLSSIVMVNVNTARAKARDTQRISDMGQLRIALELYYDSNGTYPPGNGSLGALSILVPTYIAKLPNDPLNTGTMPYWDWVNQNTYYYWGPMVDNIYCGTLSYMLWYRLETKSNGNAVPCVNLDNHSFTIVNQ
jgi:prepilin-type N-terminal cleavage/methylation domain-containing protein